MKRFVLALAMLPGVAVANFDPITDVRCEVALKSQNQRVKDFLQGFQVSYSPFAATIDASDECTADIEIWGDSAIQRMCAAKPDMSIKGVAGLTMIWTARCQPDPEMWLEQ